MNKSIAMNKTFPVRALSLAVLAVFSVQAYADEVDVSAAAPEVDLGTEYVKVERKLGRKSTEVTGLGKIIKTSEDIDSEQIMGIRDLTRYDPGIAVVEQGRGASSGYSIRGVDRNRVGLQVDGVVQAQSYITERSDSNGGAINEIEYENVKSIELSKGAASTEFGSGALGGAVSFRTKNPSDVIKEDQNWGVNAKSAYSSKNSQFANTIAAAGKTDDFEALVQFTHRKGKEIKAHKAAGDISQSITRVSATATPFELRNAPWNVTGEPETRKTDGWFVLKDECQAGNCTPKPRAEVTTDNPHTPRTEPAYTAQEQADYDRLSHITETVRAKDYTGADRVLPNPMDYESKSWLIKTGYRPNANHYIGTVFEDTTQQYDITDKTQPAYLTVQDLKDFKGSSLAKGVYRGDNVAEGVVLASNPYGRPLIYGTGVYYDEKHQKSRQGINYQYTAPASDELVDKLTVSFDRQNITLETHRHEKRCSPYQAMQKDCEADVDKPFSSHYSHRGTYQELHRAFQLAAEKQFSLFNTEHRLNLLAGLDRFKSSLYRGDYFARYVESGYLAVGGSDTYNDPTVYEAKPNTLHLQNYCQQDGLGISNCATRTITGFNQFFALNDHIKVNDYINLGLGVRYDLHHFKSDDKFTATGKYRNWSYNAGITVKPTDSIALSYRHSNAFRVPAFYELFGRRAAFDPNNPHSVRDQYVSNLQPEKATNHEFGVGLSGDFGYLEVSYFKNKYKDLIATANQRPDPNQPAEKDGYYNLQDITLDGINLLGKIDWYGVSEKLPDGLYSTLAYNRINVKDVVVKAGYVQVSSPLLDTLQPSRYVAGIGYDDPAGVWGANLTAVYSKPKKAEELYGEFKGGFGGNIAASNAASKHWYTYDLTGYWNINDHFTVRGGVYNLLNRKYITWESIRQSSLNAVNSDAGTNATRFAAPGRNFSVALEMKF